MSRPLKPWLLLFNCQAMGIANCLTMLSDQVSVEYHDPASLKAHRTILMQRLDSYDRVIVARGLEADLMDDLKGHPRVWIIHGFYFAGYHPDLCFLNSQEKKIPGPMSGCHSLIACAAFLCGLSEKQAIKLFCEVTYSQLGYFSSWTRSREALFAHYEHYGFTNELFVEWSRNGPFVYLSHHPKIACLRDIAKMLLVHAGLEVADTGALPHDNLAMGPIFPVYPEIATTLGVSGSYLFKLPGCYRHIDLAEFVYSSFSAYRGSGEIVTVPLFEAQLASTVAFVKTLL